MSRAIGKLALHFNFIKKTLQKEAMTKTALLELMQAEFGANITSRYVRREVKELMSINKIKVVKYNKETHLLWVDGEVDFQHESTDNIITLDKHFKMFIAKPSIVRQVRIPIFVMNELKKRIEDLSEDMELILDITAVKSNKVWYRLEKR